jgi:hypothetical protein
MTDAKGTTVLILLPIARQFLSIVRNCVGRARGMGLAQCTKIDRKTLLIVKFGQPGAVEFQFEDRLEFAKAWGAHNNFAHERAK